MTDTSGSTEGYRDNCCRSCRSFIQSSGCRDPTVLRNFKGEVEIAELGGELGLSSSGRLQVLEGLPVCQEVSFQDDRDTVFGHVLRLLFLNDPIHQHLLATGQTCFRGMAPSDVNRLQIDIETYCSPGFEFPNPEREEDRIIAIALSDSSGWETVLWGKELTEPEMLQRLNGIIQARDPDVIEGHNIFKFDLSYIKARAKRHGIALPVGAQRQRTIRLQLASVYRRAND